MVVGVEREWAARWREGSVCGGGGGARRTAGLSVSR